MVLPCSDSVSHEPSYFNFYEFRRLYRTFYTFSGFLVCLKRIRFRDKSSSFFGFARHYYRILDWFPFQKLLRWFTSLSLYTHRYEYVLQHKDILYWKPVNRLEELFCYYLWRYFFLWIAMLFKRSNISETSFRK